MIRGNTAEETLALNKLNSDSVNKPSHYMLFDEYGIEVKDVRKKLLEKLPEGVPYLQVTHWDRSFEYLIRMWGKNGLEDAKKAYVYLGWLIKEMELNEGVK